MDGILFQRTRDIKAHISPLEVISGIIYLKVVPSLEKDEGAIEFILNGKNYCNVNSSSLTFQPESGDIFFPFVAPS